MASMTSQIKQISLAVAFIAGLFMAYQIGFGEAASVVLDPDGTTQATKDVFGGTISILDRLAVLGVWLTVLGSAGLSIIPRTTSYPAINTLQRYMIPIVGLISFVAFWDQTVEIINGNRVWANYDDATNSYALFLAASFVAAVVDFFRK